MKRAFWFVTTTVFISIFVPQFALSAEVQGVGIARADEEACLKSLLIFKKRLQDIGLHVVRLECQSVGGEPDAFEPWFKAIAEEAMSAEMAVAGYLLSRADCEEVLEDLLKVVSSSDEVVVESGCVSLTIVDTENGEETDEQFQPVVFLLKR